MEMINKKPINSQPIIVLNELTQETQLYPSITKIEKELNIHHSYIKKHLKNGTLYKNKLGHQYKFYLYEIK